MQYVKKYGMERVMRETGATEKTVRGWMNGQKLPKKNDHRRTLKKILPEVDFPQIPGTNFKKHEETPFFFPGTAKTKWKKK